MQIKNGPSASASIHGAVLSYLPAVCNNGTVVSSPPSLPPSLPPSPPSQFYDLQELFRSGGQLPDTSYVFMVGHCAAMYTCNDMTFSLNTLLTVFSACCND